MSVFHNHTFHNIVCAQAIVCLCMTMFFVSLTFNVNTYAETTNLDIQYNYLGAMDNNEYDLNTGFPSANIVNTSINMNDVEDYYSLVLSAIQIGLGQLDKYFDFNVNITNFNYNNWYSCLQSYSFITGEINPSDRGEWLNAYIGIDENNNGYVFLQYCPRVDSINVNPVFDNSIFNGCIYYPLNVNDSQVTFTFYHDVTFNNTIRQGLMISSGLSGNSGIPDGRMYVTDYEYTGSWIPALWGDLYSDHTYFSNLSVSNYNILNYKHRFFYPNDTSSLYYISYSDGVTFKYLLPLYVDSTIYLFNNDNNIETYIGNLHYGNTLGGYYDYVYNNLTVQEPVIFNSINYVAFSPSNFPRIEKGYGIIYNPIYTPTPIPTFSILYTPTPFPTNIFSPTVTPINLPLNPIIQIGDYGKPWDFISGIIPILHSALNSGTVHLFVQTIEYIYNTSLFFEVILFLIPSICLLAFILGRLKRK